MFFIGRTDGQTHGQLKTIVRNLTKKHKQSFYVICKLTETILQKLFYKDDPFCEKSE